jgi:alkyl hydroperoxide reductase subunit AhpC
MLLKLNQIAPDFTQESTEGPIHFHGWVANSWAILFSHPKDFMPVCNTELGVVAKLKPEFAKRGVKVIGLSVDRAGDHARWASDIAETQGMAPNYPILADADFKVCVCAKTERERKALKTNVVGD